MNQPTVAVVILTWNGKKFLEQFLPALLTTTYPAASFYVADNASSDDSVEFLRKNFPNVQVITLEKNSGFAEGYNIALRQVRADYYVLLNQDVEVTSGWIEPVLALMENDKRIAACQPKLRAFYDKEYFEYAGAAGGFLDRHGYAFCRGRFFHSVEKDTGQYDTGMEIVWASGACLFIRAQLYHDLGGLDKDFFAHFEEIDLCWRLKNAGYSIRYCPDSLVYHVGGGSLSKENPKKTFLNYRNNLSAIIKNQRGHVALILAMRIFLDIISAWKTLLSGDRGKFAAIFKAHVSFVASLPALLAKRKATRTKINRYKISAPHLAGFYRGSIIADFFLRKSRSFDKLKKEKFHS